MTDRPVDDVTEPPLQRDAAAPGGYVSTMPSDFALKTMNTVHRGLLKLTCGRAGYRVSNMPVLELTTIGRKSGQPRSVMLTSPVQDGQTLVVVASRGGDDTNPAWFLNLCDNPKVDVALQGGPKQPMQARVATPDERSTLWPRVVADHKNYAGYQTKTSREIPLVLLEPARSN
jgi:deazaflavin-dependent oxidoreductase (nitroreductase family)